MIAIKNFRIPIYTLEVAEELSTVVRHLKQIGKVKKHDKWADFMSWQKIKKKNRCLSCHLILCNNSEQFLDWIVKCNKKWILYDSQWWLAQWLDWEAPEHFPKPNLHQKKGHGHCLLVCCPSDLRQFSESWWNHYLWEVCSADLWDALRTANACSWRWSTEWAQYLTACHTANASKVEWTGLQSFASLTIFTWPLTNHLPFFQVSQQLFAGKMLPQPASGRKCFPRVGQIPKHRFLVLQE